MLTKSPAITELCQLIRSHILYCDYLSAVNDHALPSVPIQEYSTSNISLGQLPLPVPLPVLAAVLEINLYPHIFLLFLILSF